MRTSEAAEIFVERCSGCHTLTVAGTEGSTTNVRTREYKDGPNFDQRKVTENCALYAIRNGGFSSGPMPQDIVVGRGRRAAGRVPGRVLGQRRRDPARRELRPPPTAPRGSMLDLRAIARDPEPVAGRAWRAVATGPTSG